MSKTKSEGWFTNLETGFIEATPDGKTSVALFEATADATPKDMALAASAPALREALKSLLQYDQYLMDGGALDEVEQAKAALKAAGGEA